LDGDVFRPGSSQIRERLGWTKEHWVIGYVGRLAHVKGVDLLAQAFRQIVSSQQNLRLIIIGSGEEEKKVRADLDAELKKGIVHIESDVPQHLLAEWYRAMDLFVMPSRYENYSNAVLEAMACEVPFLVSDVGGNRRLAETRAGWLFASGSVDSLVQKVHCIAKDPSLGRHYGVMCREIVYKQYSWKASAQQLETVFRSCLQREVEATCKQ
jgi:glycosyltransferase involved in cell wall biosynthesis